MSDEDIVSLTDDQADQNEKTEDELRATQEYVPETQKLTV